MIELVIHKTFSSCGSFSCLAHRPETTILTDSANNWQDHQSFKIHMPQPKIAEPAVIAVLGGGGEGNDTVAEI